MAAAKKLIKYTLVLLSSALTTACVTPAASVFDSKASSLNFTRSLLTTQQFDLAVFANAAQQETDHLHIYIEGDGQPFFRNRYINPDPTSRQGLMLELMALDPTPAVLLGRPCYHGQTARNCDDSKWWTSHRYSEQVVESLLSAINLLNPKEKNIRLIGFSGGGALAMLTAPRLNRENTEVITISANLDIDAWARRHAYTPLYGSLNPIELIDSVDSIKQTHFIGKQDSNIPYQVWENRVAQSKNSSVKVFSEMSHGCCWASIWRDFISQLNNYH